LFSACRPRASACASASERSTGTPNPFEQLGTPKPFDQSLSCPSLTTYKSSGAFPTLSAEGSVSAAGEFALLNSTPPPPPGSTPAHSWPTWSGKELRRLIWANGHSRSRALTRYLLSLLGRKMLELARSAESTRSQPVQPSEASHPARANRLGPSESGYPSRRGRAGRGPARPGEAAGLHGLGAEPPHRTCGASGEAPSGRSARGGGTEITTGGRAGQKESSLRPSSPLRLSCGIKHYRRITSRNVGSCAGFYGSLLPRPVAFQVTWLGGLRMARVGVGCIYVYLGLHHLPLFWCVPTPPCPVRPVTRPLRIPVALIKPERTCVTSSGTSVTATTYSFPPV
jgi:hypothetical protein